MLTQMRRQQIKAAHNQGGALISALFITAIVAVMATSLAVRGRLIIHEAELVQSADQTYLNLQTVQDWARDQLYRYLLQWQSPSTSPNRLKQMTWSFKKRQLGDRVVNGVIYDAQGRYNLNDLIYTANQPRFVALLRAVSPAVSQKQAYAIAQAITDWLTKGKLDSVYEQENPPYVAPAHQMADRSELRLVDGVDASLYNKLKPYIVALPVHKTTSTQQSTDSTDSQSSSQSTASQTPININSASWPALIAALPALTPVQAQSAFSCRARFKYFTGVDAFIQDCIKPMGLDNIKGPLTTYSQYYILESKAIKGDLAVHLDSLLMSQRQKNNKLKVDVVWQAYY